MSLHRIELLNPGSKLSEICFYWFMIYAKMINKSGIFYMIVPYFFVICLGVPINQIRQAFSR